MKLNRLVSEKDIHPPPIKIRSTKTPKLLNPKMNVNPGDPFGMNNDAEFDRGDER
jgi:hypothetical protein